MLNLLSPYRKKTAIVLWKCSLLLDWSTFKVTMFYKWVLPYLFAYIPTCFGPRPYSPHWSLLHWFRGAGNWEQCGGHPLSPVSCWWNYGSSLEDWTAERAWPSLDSTAGSSCWKEQTYIEKHFQPIWSCTSTSSRRYFRSTSFSTYVYQ